MATKKPKYNPDDVERWVTVKGARIPIMKDGTLGIGSLEGEGARQVKERMKSEYYSDKLSNAQLKKAQQTADKLAKQIYDEDIGERTTQKMIRETADKLKLDAHDFDVFYSDVKDKIRHLSDPHLDDDIAPKDNWEEFANKATKQKPVSRNARYDTSRSNTNKIKPTALQAFKENSRQLNVALEEGQKRNVLEVHYTDMTGKLYKSYWNGSKFTGDKVKQDMAKKYGKKAGIYKASFKKPKEWE